MIWPFSRKPKEPEVLPYRYNIKYSEVVLYDDMKGDIKLVEQKEVAEHEWQTHGSIGILVYTPTLDENGRATERLINFRVISPKVTLEAYEHPEKFK
jgi:hypothetical protein